MSSHANSPSLLTLSFPEQKPSKMSVTQRCEFTAERNGTVVKDRRPPAAAQTLPWWPGLLLLPGDAGAPHSAGAERPAQPLGVCSVPVAAGWWLRCTDIPRAPAQGG